MLDWLDVWAPSETLPKPLSDAGEIAAARATPEEPLTACFEVFEVRGLRVDQQAGRDCKRRPFRRFRQARDAERPADAHRTAENMRGEFRQSGHLTGTAGDDDAPARFGREGRGFEPVADHFQNSLDARLDEILERGAGHELRVIALVLADRRHRDHVALVRAADSPPP